MKEEVLSSDPWVALLYDVITDAEAEEMKTTALPIVSIRQNLMAVR